MGEYTLPEIKTYYYGIITMWCNTAIDQQSNRIQKETHTYVEMQFMATELSYTDGDM